MVVIPAMGFGFLFSHLKNFCAFFDSIVRS